MLLFSRLQINIVCKYKQVSVEKKGQKVEDPGQQKNKEHKKQKHSKREIIL